MTAHTQPANPKQTAAQLTDTPVDVKFRLSALWIATLFVYAYVDIFGFFRQDSLEALLAGDAIPNTPFEVTQGFLIFTVLYILPASLMVFASLILKPQINRLANVIVAGLYMITVAGSCIGETWIYYWIGSAVEVVLLAILIRTAWRWPSNPS